MERGRVEPIGLEVRAGTRQVPAALWRPDSPAAPLVLLGHGGSGHKTSPRQSALAARLVALGLAVVAIDGPAHGERIVGPMTPAAYQRALVDRGMDRVVGEMVEDWLAAIEAAGRLGGVDTGRLGYLGLSMGTRFGLPLAAALGDRLGVAALGKFGLLQSHALPPGLHLVDSLRADAAAIVAPTLWHVQWDDEIFPRPGSLELFEEIGTPDKRLVAFPGGHAETAADAIDAWVTFLVRRLTVSAP